MHTNKTLLLALVSFFITSQAHTEIEEILVTSQHQKQRISEVPFSVTAIDDKTLTSLNISQLSQLSSVVPGLYISDTESSHPTYNIRGLSSGSPSAQAAARIAIYLNDADISRNRSSHIELHDLARIEVIKGPQSTLFGTTAAAGAIAYYTAKPSADAYSKIRLNAGNFNHFEVQAVANGGNETVQARVALLSRNRDGYIDNNFANSPALGSLNRFSIRPSLHWNISSDWSADLVITHETSGDTITANKSAIIAPPGGNTSPFSAAALSGSSVSSAIFPSTSLNIDRSTNDVNLQFNGNLGKWAVSSLSAYRKYDSITPFDADGSQVEAFEILEQANGDQFSQELRGLFTQESLTVRAALSYLTESNQRSNAFSADEGSYLMCVPLARNSFSQLFNQFAVFSPQIAALAAIIDPNNGLPCTNADGSVNSLTPFATGGALQSLPYFALLEDASDNATYSALVDVGYEVSERWHIDTGIRFLSEDRESAFSAISPPAVLLQGLSPLLALGDTNGQRIESESSDNDLLFRFSTRYEWQDNHFAYAGFSQGRRSVVVNINSTLDSNFQPLVTNNLIPAEKMNNFELGLKGESSKLSYSAAIFYQRYKDFQVRLLDNTGRFIVANAGDTSNPGAELSLKWQSRDDLSIFSHISIFDNTLDTDNSNGVFSGKRLENSSEYTATFGLNYQGELGANALSLNLYGNYRSEFATDPVRQPIDPVSGLALSQAGFTVFNGSVVLSSTNDWSVSFWINNITDKQYLADISDIGANLGMPTFQAAEPRTFGITLSLER